LLHAGIHDTSSKTFDCDIIHDYRHDNIPPGLRRPEASWDSALYSYRLGAWLPFYKRCLTTILALDRRFGKRGEINMLDRPKALVRAGITLPNTAETLLFCSGNARVDGMGRSPYPPCG
jgi:hypothetical protein